MHLPRRLALAALLAAVPASALAAPSARLDVRPGYDAAGVCLDLTLRGRLFQDTICPPPGDLAPRTASSRGATAFYGATSPRTRRVDLILSSGRTERVRTRSQSGARVYVTAVRGTPSLASIVARGAGGRARAARDLNPFLLPPVGRRATFARLRDQSGKRVTLVGHAARVLVGQPNRRKRALCTALRLRGAAGAGAGAGRTLCVHEPRKFDVRFSADCDARRQLVYGIGPASIRSLVAVLTSGARRAVRLERVPRGVRRRGVVLAARFDGALAKRVIGYGADGSELATAVLKGGCRG